MSLLDPTDPKMARVTARGTLMEISSSQNGVERRKLKTKGWRGKDFDKGSKSGVKMLLKSVTAGSGRGGKLNATPFSNILLFTPTIIT